MTEHAGPEPRDEGRRWTLEPYRDGEHWPKVRIDGRTSVVRVPVEVMPVSEHEARVRQLEGGLERILVLEEIERLATVACEAEFTGERLAAMGFLRAALSRTAGEESMRETDLGAGPAGERIATLTEALKQADKALRENITAWVTVAPILEANVYDPRDDGYVWNAWTRFGERAGKKASAARTVIRAALSTGGSVEQEGNDDE